jgi:hypothetical protein
MRSIFPYVNVAESNKEQGHATIKTAVTAGKILAVSTSDQKINVASAIDNKT